jgi:hypothetical protein
LLTRKRSQVQPCRAHHTSPQLRPGPRARPLTSVAWHQVVGQQTGSNRDQTGGRPCATGAADQGDCWAVAACPCGKGLPARGSQGVGRLELHSGRLPHPRSGGWSRATCSFAERLVTARARCCPRFTRQLRTQHGPKVPVRLVAEDGSAEGVRDQEPIGRPGHGKADQCRTNTLQLSPTRCALPQSAVRIGDGDQTTWLARPWSAHSPDPCTRSQTRPSPGR